VRARVLGLGNDLLGDDGVGLEAARVATSTPRHPAIEVVASSVGGLGLLEELEGCDAAVVVDSIRTGEAPEGRVLVMRPEDLPYGPRLRGAHDADLAAALELGRRSGRSMPGRVFVVAVEVEDNLSFREGLTPPAREAAREAAKKALELAEGFCRETLGTGTSSRPWVV